MVLRLKTRESRSSPGLPRTGVFELALSAPGPLSAGNVAPLPCAACAQLRASRALIENARNRVPSSTSWFQLKFALSRFALLERNGGSATKKSACGAPRGASRDPQGSRSHRFALFGAPSPHLNEGHQQSPDASCIAATVALGSLTSRSRPCRAAHHQLSTRTFRVSV